MFPYQLEPTVPNIECDLLDAGRPILVVRAGQAFQH